MSTPFTIEVAVHFHRRGPGAGKELRLGAAAPLELTTERVPRVARLMALALRFDDLLRSRQIASYGALASLGHVTRARVCQIMNLLCLAPDIQEALLFLTRPARGRDPSILADLQPLTALLDWGKQRRRWQRLVAARPLRSERAVSGAAVPDGTKEIVAGPSASV
jgi:hypothetical protein